MVFKLEKARPRRVGAVQNWIEGNSYIARNEVEFLQYKEDLIALSSLEDRTMTCLGEWVEDKMIKFFAKS